MKNVDRCKDALEISGVVRCPWIGAVQGVEGGVDIGNQIDSCISEGTHALIVVLGVVDVVHTDRVQPKLFEPWDVAIADGRIGERVGGRR